MNGIIKRRKTADYAQIHNDALQQLEDIRSIGLKSHLMSLPESWVISKMQLYKKFGRGPITNAIAELEAKKYWVTIQYRNGRKTLYYYNVSDVAFGDTEVLAMIWEVKGAGHKMLELSESFSHLLSIGENQQLKTEEDSSVGSSIVGNEQLMVNSSKSTVENRHLLNKELKTKNNKQNKDKETLLINNEELTTDVFRILLINYCYEFYSEFGLGRWDKKSWYALIETFVIETIQTGRYINVPSDKIRGYSYQSLKNIAYKHDYKNGKVERKIEIYDWLNESSEDKIPY